MRSGLHRSESKPGYRGPCVKGLITTCLLATVLSSSAISGELIGVPGITEPIHDVVLSLPTTGTVAAIFFNEGDHIKSGNVIMNLDNRLETLEVARRKLIWESKDELNSATTRVATLRSQLASTLELYKTTGSFSKEEVEQQQLEYDLAVAEKMRLENNEERERIEYEIAVEQLDKRSLRAPFSGILTELKVDVGETSELDDPLAHMVDVSQCLFVCTVEEKIGRFLKNGTTVALELETGGEPSRINGKIVYVDPVVDPASGLQRVKVLFSNKGGKIRPGVAGTMFISASQ